MTKVMTVLGLLMIFSTTTYAESKISCESYYNEIHKAASVLSDVHDSKWLVEHETHYPARENNVYTNNWQTVPAGDEDRIVKEFTETLIPNLILASYQNYVMLQNLDCEGDYKTRVMADIKALNNKLITKQIVVVFKHSISDDAGRTAGQGAEAGLEAVCGKNVSLGDSCFGPGALTGGVIGTVLAYPVGYIKALANAHNFASGTVVISLPQGAEAYLIP